MSNNKGDWRDEDDKFPGAVGIPPESSEPSPTSERTPNWFICPQCQLTKFGTANPQCFATGEPQILECHGLASDGPPFGCGWKGTWDDVLKAWAKREVVQEFAAGLIKRMLIVHKNLLAASLDTERDVIETFSDAISSTAMGVAANEVHAFALDKFGVDVDYYKIRAEVLKERHAAQQHSPQHL